MKVSPRNVDGFLSQPPKDIFGILFYGPDHGLVRERARLVCGTVGGGDAEVKELMGDQLKKDPALLADAAASLSLLGGAPVVLVRDATDNLVKPIELWIEDGGGINPSVFMAGELSPRSKLRQFFEKHASTAAIGCYADTGRDLNAVIHGHITKAGFSINIDAMELLKSYLGEDRMAIRQELDKLLLYMDNMGPEIVEDDISAILGDGRATAYDDVAMHTASGDREKLAITLNRIDQEDTSPHAVLRSVQRHFERLLSVKRAVDMGESPKEATKKLRPPIFFKQEAAFLRQVDQWPMSNLKKTLALLLKTERDCKYQHSIDRILFERAMLQICLAAQKSKRY